MGKKHKFAILKNENEYDHIDWINACKKKYVLFSVIDITKSDWIEEVISEDYDCFLSRPGDKVAYYKQLYDERLYIINYIIGKMIYPSFEENLIYENKKFLSYWLKATNTPHPKTWIFYSKNEALDFADKCLLPVVAKTSIGSAGSGVKIFHDRKEIGNYIEKSFSNRGIKRHWGPNLKKGEIGKRAITHLKNLPKFFHYMKGKYRAASLDPQRGYVIFQQFIKCDFEWRAVRIGNSYFAHKKLRSRGNMFSGTSKVSWDGPSRELLNFVKEITDKRKFLCQAIDIFEPEPEKFFVNEMQCFWGSKNPHQMIINGKPGRYTLKNGDWSFEEGNFNSNNSYDLRLTHCLEILNKNKK